MAGHSHWKQIKAQKGVADQKRGKAFSILLKSITVAAKEEQNPDFNPRLRTTIEKAKQAGVPQDNIARAISSAKTNPDELEEVTMEAYGPSGSAIIIEAITDSRNRTIAEVKNILKDHEAKWAEPGSVKWAFDAPTAIGEPWQPKFKQEISGDDKVKLEALIEALEENGDAQRVYNNSIL